MDQINIRLKSWNSPLSESEQARILNAACGADEVCDEIVVAGDDESYFTVVSGGDEGLPEVDVIVNVIRWPSLALAEEMLRDWQQWHRHQRISNHN